MRTFQVVETDLLCQGAEFNASTGDFRGFSFWTNVYLRSIEPISPELLISNSRKILEYNLNNKLWIRGSSKEKLLNNKVIIADSNFRLQLPYNNSREFHNDYNFLYDANLSIAIKSKAERVMAQELVGKGTKVTINIEIINSDFGIIFLNDENFPIQGMGLFLEVEPKEKYNEIIERLYNKFIVPESVLQYNGNVTLFVAGDFRYLRTDNFPKIELPGVANLYNLGCKIANDYDDFEFSLVDAEGIGFHCRK